MIKRYTEKQIMMKNIKVLRVFNDLSQAELAKSCKLSQSTIAQIESGKKDPSLSTLIKISAGLKIDLPTLFKPMKVYEL